MLVPKMASETINRKQRAVSAILVWFMCISFLFAHVCQRHVMGHVCLQVCLTAVLVLIGTGSRWGQLRSVCWSDYGSRRVRWCRWAARYPGPATGSGCPV